MQKTIMNYYPDITAANDLKVFQDRTSQIKGIHFKRDCRHKLPSLMADNKYILYFLFTESNDLYIDGTVEGLDDVIDKVEFDDAIHYGIMFMSDDDGNFSRQVLDYLVHMYQEKFLDAGYYILNDPLTNDLMINMYDQPIYDKYLVDIEYLLNAEGYMRGSDVVELISEQEEPRKVGLYEFDLDEVQLVEQSDVVVGQGQSTSAIKVPRTVKVSDFDDGDDFIKYYYPTDSFYDAKIYVSDDRGPNKRFTMEVGSIVRRPLPQTKLYKDSSFYNDFNERIDQLLKKNRIEIHDESLSEYKVVRTIGFRKPSPMACLVAGTPQNGWKFFNGLSRIR